MARRSRFGNDPRPLGGHVAPAAQATDEQEGEEGDGAVRGPTSALTSFLREQGIRPRHAHPYARNLETVDQEPEQDDEPAGAEQPVGDSAHIPQAELDSDDLDEPVASTSRAPAAVKVEGGPTKKRKGKPVDERKPAAAKAARTPVDRPPGHITSCCECGRKFTVTKYTPSNPAGQGQFCDACAKEGSGAARSGSIQSGAAAPNKRVKRAPKLADQKAEAAVPSLQVSCINVIAKSIEQIEALGDIGAVNLDRICRIVSKHRALVPDTLPLFLDVAHTDLRLYDCVRESLVTLCPAATPAPTLKSEADLLSDQLESIGHFCPHLEVLVLNFCGHLDGEVVRLYARRLTSLKHLELLGAYLVRVEDWQDLFSSWKQSASRQGDAMRAFMLTQSPRLDSVCLAALVDACPNLSELRLADVGQLTDTGLGLLHPLVNLTRLEIPNAGIFNGATGERLTDDGVVGLLAAIGRNLETLDISANKLLTDRVLLEGVKPFCASLKMLNLSGLGNLLTSGVSALFDGWENKGLTELRLARCIRLGDEALSAVLEHSGPSMDTLDLNSLDELRADGLKHLGEASPALEHLDVSFVRDVDDFVLKALLDGMPRLRTVRVFGNHKISEACPRRKGTRIIGQERSIIVAA